VGKVPQNRVNPAPGADLQAEVYRLAVEERLTVRQIAARIERSPTYTHEILTKAVASIPAAAKDAARRKLLEMYDFEASLIAQAHRDGEISTLQRVDALRKLGESVARLDGLNAPRLVALVEPESGQAEASPEIVGAIEAARAARNARMAALHAGHDPDQSAS